MSNVFIRNSSPWGFRCCCCCCGFCTVFFNACKDNIPLQFQFKTYGHCWRKQRKQLFIYSYYSFFLSFFFFLDFSFLSLVLQCSLAGVHGDHLFSRCRTQYMNLWQNVHTDLGDGNTRTGLSSQTTRQPHEEATLILKTSHKWWRKEHEDKTRHNS